MSSPALIALRLLTVIGQAQATVAEGWGAPPSAVPLARVEKSHHQAAFLHEASSEQVTLTAGGSLHRPASMVRHHQHHDHHTAHAEAMFKALDLDGDGAVTGNEVRTTLQTSDFHIPKAIERAMAQATEHAEGGISLASFRSAVKDAAKHHKLHHNADAQHNHATVHQHEHKHQGELVEKADGEPNCNVPASKEAWVTCGGHKAESCKMCPTTDDHGCQFFDHGAERCNGECVYSDGVCRPATGANAAAAPDTEIKPQAAEKKPDILNPNITEKDTEIINAAAEDAIREENTEATEKLKKEEEEKADGKKFDWGKFWLIVIITFSVILGICAIASIVAVVVFCFMTSEDSPAKDIGDEEPLDEPLMDGAAEAES